VPTSDEVVEVLGGLVDVELDPGDAAGEGIVVAVVVADGVALSRPTSVVSSPEKAIGTVSSTRPPPSFSPSRYRRLLRIASA
jgi:hypothetical protein